MAPLSTDTWTVSPSPSCTSRATGTVEGTVYVDGQPMGGFEITYKSDEDGSVAIGASQNDGRYKLFIGRANERIRTGKYHVTLEPSGMITGVPRPSVQSVRSQRSSSQ